MHRRLNNYVFKENENQVGELEVNNTNSPIAYNMLKILEDVFNLKNKLVSNETSESKKQFLENSLGDVWEDIYSAMVEVVRVEYQVRQNYCF